MQYDAMNTTITQLVGAIRKGDKKAQAELERRATVNGANSRAAKALEGLKVGGPATIGEFFAGVKAGTVTPKVKAKPAAAKAATKRATSPDTWGYLTAPNGKQVGVDKLATDLSTVVSGAIRRSLINALTK